MTVAAFDTLTVTKDLQQAGLEEKHSEAIAFAVKQVGLTSRQNRTSPC